MTLSFQTPPNPVRTSVEGTVDVSARQIDVSAHGIVSAGGHVLVSADGTHDVSAHGIVSAAGRVTTYFALPAGHIADDAQAESRIAINVSGASAGNYALVSAPASGVWRISRLFLVFNSAANATFRNVSAAASSIDLTGPMFVGDKGGIVLDKSDSPWFVGTGTKNFSINVSAGVGIRGAVYWY